MRNLFLAAGLTIAVGAAAHAQVPTDAVEDIHSALAESDADTSTLTRLVMMLREMGDYEQADALLADLAKSGVEIDLTHDFSGGQVLPGYEEETGRGTIGPDVIVGDLNGVGYYGQASGIAAYAIGTTSCNIGDEILLWVSNNNHHPVIGQNMYRLKDGIFEQIGMSHLKHGFLALSGSVCQSCTGPGGSQLSPGCSDPYSTGLNAGQSRLGPRWQVNAYNGVYPYPFFSGSFENSATGRRIQVDIDDVNPSQNSGAVYWGEGQYVTADDAQAGHGLNNASYRRVQFNSSLQPSWIGSTVREKPAILGWADFDSEVEIVNADVSGEGRFIVASRVYDNGDGTWTYAYAIHNMNSDRSGQSLSIPTGGASLTDVGFHSPFYHSSDGINGNTYPNTDWTFDDGDGATWSSETFAQNNNANALRWGTTYSYWFTSDAAPEMTTASLDLFKPGTPGSVDFQVLAPAGCAITADTNGDNVVNFADLNTVLGAFGDSGSGVSGDVNGDDVVDFSDLNAVLAEFGLDCN